MPLSRISGLRSSGFTHAACVGVLSALLFSALLPACGSSSHTSKSKNAPASTDDDDTQTTPTSGAGGKSSGSKPGHAGASASAGDSTNEDSSNAGSSGSGENAGAPGVAGGCDISAIFSKSDYGCTASNCHGKQFQGGVDLVSPGIAERLVGTRSITQACGGQLLIDPNSPDDSLLLRLLDAKRFNATPNQCGVMMPFGSEEGLVGDDLACVESWVHAVSAGKGNTVPAPVPFEPVGPESYLAKVKLLLNGDAVTADELTQIKADPSALAGLVDKWTSVPAFQTKMQDFFRVALQQRLVGTLNFQLDTVEGPHQTQLKTNAEESFLRTAWDLVANRQPFNGVLTTRRFAVTSALLVAIAYEDGTATSLRADKHTLYRDPPVGTPAAPWPLSYEVQNKTWLMPQLDVTCPKIALTDPDLYDMMMGLVRCPQPLGNVSFSTGTVLTTPDFADWHFVEIKPATAAHPATKFYDVDALRNTDTVYLSQPRVGFFTTPAFLGNWDTNDGNSFRVTTSQTLITALGEALSPADPTPPLHIDGLDQAHAPKDSTCYGCHRFLDPMRLYFQEQYSTAYQAASSAPQSQPSLAFHGVTLDGGRVGDFAAALANHPLFATAWVQKLCYYANSQACDVTDPEVLRIAKAFTDSNYDFLTLVKELFTSPLVTGAAQTQSYTDSDLLVSITRRQHFCQMIDQRLGTVNTCLNAGSVVNLIPQDEFSRGSPVPVQPAVTGLFHFAAAEKVCSTIATKLVTTTGRFKVGAPQASILDMVGYLMGLPTSHSRYVVTYNQLTNHYNQARLLGASTTSALQDTFTVACMSPDVMGVGL